MSGTTFFARTNSKLSNYHYPNDFKPNRISFDSKSIVENGKYNLISVHIIGIRRKFLSVCVRDEFFTGTNSKLENNSRNSDCIYHFPNEFKPNRSRLLFKINRKMVNTIWFRRKFLPVCVRGKFFAGANSKLWTNSETLRPGKVITYFFFFLELRRWDRSLRKLYFHFHSHWMAYDRGDSFPFAFEKW